MTVEKTLERKLYSGMKARGGKALKFYCLSFTGMPDRICLAPGARIWFVELKSTGKKPSKIQEVVIRWLRSLGFQVFVIDRQAQLDEFFTIVDLTA
jgi:hypothetical protein